jgi:ribosomal protein S17E
MIVSIHQPNFLPWEPFMQKVQAADVFVVMGNCQFEKNGFQNRFNMNGKWYTMSVKRGLDPIIEKLYVNHTRDWETIKRKLPAFEKVLSHFDDCIGESLFETNYKIIERSANIMGLNTKIVTDYKSNLKATDRLIDICERNGAESYISGPSGRKYLDLPKFKARDIEVVFQESDSKRTLLEVLKDVI